MVKLILRERTPFPKELFLEKACVDMAEGVFLKEEIKKEHCNRLEFSLSVIRDKSTFQDSKVERHTLHPLIEETSQGKRCSHKELESASLEALQ